MHLLTTRFMKQYQKQIDAMEKIYSTAKICAFNEPAKCGLSLEPGFII